MIFRRNKRQADAVEREKIARLEKAETELHWLKARAYVAIVRLDERQNRNHFAEALRATMNGSH